MILDHLPVAIGSWPQTRATEAAFELASEHEPAYLLNHSIRSYFYARSIGAGKGLRAGEDYDDEVLFVATLLHDLGLTDAASGDERFEVAGANRAVEFARQQGLTDSARELIWDAIALHTSRGIAGHKRPEVALAHFGISVDIFGFGVEEVEAAVLEAAQQSFPWLDLRDTLIEKVAHQVSDNPAKWAPMSFVSAATRRIDPDAPFPELDDLCRN